MMIAYFIAALALVSLTIDLIILKRVKRKFPEKRWLYKAYLCHVILLDAVIIAALAFYKQSTAIDSNLYMQVILWVICIFFMNIVVKFSYVLVSLFDFPLSKIRRKRSTFCNKAGALLAIALLGVMIWGASGGRSIVRVEEVELEYKNLPKAFDGYTIALFTDVHTGNLPQNNRLLKRMTAKINALHPDMIVNAGDLVNISAAELSPDKIEILSQLKARDGIYSVQGNHDLGFYIQNKSLHTPQESVAELEQKQRDMGWILLNNTTHYIVRNTDSIAVSGIKYPTDEHHNGHDTGLGGADLEATYRAVPQGIFNIMVSHTPKYWGRILENGYADLTLSGHVHAMQMKLKIGSWMWSPARWMYEQWSGLYKNGDKHLYINDGIGYVMYPMRLGTRPEVTLITLHSL